MVRPYIGRGPEAVEDLKNYFPDFRPPPPPRTFEFAIAAAGGISTGSYTAGVLDFFIEALDEFAAEQAKNAAGAPTHKVRLVNLTGASAGGLSAGVASTCLLKDVPHVYAKAKWDELVSADLQQGSQKPEFNPLYAGWVQQADLEELLAKPTDAETNIALFAPEPAKIGKSILSMLESRLARRWPAWAAKPLDLRLVVGNLRGVPYTLNFENNVFPRAGESLTLHRDHVAFAVSPCVERAAPDAHGLLGVSFNRDPAWNLFESAAIASSAIPGVFAPVAMMNLDPDVYQWRDCYFDTTLGKPILDLPCWSHPPRPYSFTATDGGLFDNEPFDLAHRMLAGAQGTNPRRGDEANRAVILVLPVADQTGGNPQDPILPAASGPAGDSPPTSPVSGLVSALWSIVNAPIEQSRWDAFDLALIKSEYVFSRFMISPARENPNPAKPRAMVGPSKSLMSTPLHLALGFAAEAYRRHDFLLGRRNAQRFLADHFMLPGNNPVINMGDPWEPTDLKRVTDRETGVSTIYYPIIPLRGTAHQRFREPLPPWEWEALTQSRIDELGSLFGGRALNVLNKIKASLPNPNASPSFWARLVCRSAAFLLGILLWAAWGLCLRGMLVSAFTSLLTKAREQLNPANY